MKQFTIEGFERPRLRQGVSLSISGRTASLDYRAQGCELEFPPDTEREVPSLMAALRDGGRSVHELSSLWNGLSESLPSMLRELDALGLLTESATADAAGVMSGAQFYRELRRLVLRVKRKHARSSFYNGLLDGSVSSRQLIGFAIEYYHLVYMAPTICAPALAYVESPRSKELLINFYASELHHDKFLTSALSTVGLDEATLRTTTPLPSTFALCASLAAYARQHLLSFKAALFLFEEPCEEFNRAFEKRCNELALPERFCTSIVKHATLNESAEHDAISELLLSDIEAVNAEEQCVTKKHQAILVETLARQEAEILEYYGDAKQPVPRIFS